MIRTMKSRNRWGNSLPKLSIKLHGAWSLKDRGIGIQFVDTQKGKVVWEDYDEFDITYMIEGSYITFNDIAFQLAGAPWVIKSYTKNHITLIQNEASPDKDKIATIELDRVD